MIAVFKTNAQHQADAMRIVQELSGIYPGYKISVDWEDEDRILRVEGETFNIGDIYTIINYIGFNCVHLPVDLISHII